jgi:manganese-dependent inorganic pyrophosphatase
MLTDLLRNDCILIVVGNNLEKLEEIYNSKVVDNRMYLPGVLSRKKQILPPLMEKF